MSDITAKSVHEEQRKLTSLQVSYDVLLENLYREYDAAAKQGHIGFNQPYDYPEVVKLRGQIQEQAHNVAALQEQIGGKVYRVPSPNVGVLESKIAKVNRRATKLGTVPVSLTDSGEREYVDIIAPWDPEMCAQQGISVLNSGQKIGVREYRFLVLAGETPRIPGFEFLATIEHTEAGNIVKRIPQIRAEIRLQGVDTEAIDLTQYRQGEAVCEHCKLARNRKDTFLVFNQAEGTLVQVGRNCLGDYTGINDPDRIASMMTFLRDLDLSMEGEDEEMWSSGRVPEMWLTEEYLGHVAACIRNYGWTPRSSGDNATADAAIYNLKNYGRFDSKTGDPLFVEVEDEDEARGQSALEWVRALPESERASDYMHNLFVACSLEAITHKQAGIVASVIAAHDRAMERETKRRLEAERKANAANEWIGQVGDKLVVEATLTFDRAIEGYYGMTTIMEFTTPEGNVIKWFRSGSHEGDEAKGTKFQIKGTVKKLDEYNGTKQTILTRCKLVAIEEVSAA